MSNKLSHNSHRGSKQCISQVCCRAILWQQIRKTRDVCTRSKLMRHPAPLRGSTSLGKTFAGVSDAGTKSSPRPDQTENGIHRVFLQEIKIEVQIEDKSVATPEAYFASYTSGTSEEIEENATLPCIGGSRATKSPLTNEERCFAQCFMYSSNGVSKSDSRARVRDACS